MDEIQKLPFRGGELRYPRLMIQDQAQRDSAPARRNFGQVLRQRVVEIELVLIGQHHHGHGGELLADRADLIDRLRLRGHLVFQCGDSIAFEVERFAVLDHGERHAGNVLPPHLGLKIAVDCRCRISFGAPASPGTAWRKPGRRGLTWPCVCRRDRCRGDLRPRRRPCQRQNHGERSRAIH